MYLAHLEKLTRTRLEDVLVEEGVAERERVEDAQAETEKTGRQLSEILIEREILTDFDLAKLVATHYGLPYLDVSGFSTRREVTELLPPDYCARHAILPLDQFGSTLTLAVAEMPGQDVIDQIVDRTKLTPFFFVALRRALLDVLEAEKKRGPGRGARSKTVVAQVPAPKPAARPAAAASPAAPDPAPPAGDPPLPDLDLPAVSMKLVGGGSPRTAPAPARAPTQFAPAAAKSASPGASGAGLGWMDAVGGGASSPAAEAPPRPRISKFPFAAQTGGAKPSARDTHGGGRQQASVAPQKAAPAPAASSAKGAGQAPAGAGWQSIFDVGEEEVKKTKFK